MNDLNLHERWLIKRDMPDVLAIERELFSSPWTEAEFLRALRQRNVVGKVVEVGVRVVAFCVYELLRDRLQILNFAVAAEFHRRGVGSFLIDRLAAELGPQRRNRILAEVWDANLTGQLFFRSRGFRCIGIERDFYEDQAGDCYLMQLLLRDRVQRRLIP